MEILSVKNLNFKYPEREKSALKNINLSIIKGEFITICGKSGCGKTTLLRQFKPSIAPHGEVVGDVIFSGVKITELDKRQECEKIGFVGQRPENQIVTDKVWHELAFGLENLGYSTEEIRGRVAEMASFFGIQNWFHKDVTRLSGGQKQLLNLASVMVMQPEVLILDEPTAQLDPITAVNFLETVAKINRELGTTIIITEHRLEEVFPISDRIVVMDKGEIIADDKPKAIGEKLIGHHMFEALPTPTRIYHRVNYKGECPVTIREGRKWLQSLNLQSREFIPECKKSNDTIIELKNIWFKYEKDSPDIVKNLNIKIPKAEIYAIIGGNGTGKTTALSIIGGILKPYRGKVLISDKKQHKIAILPQEPQCLFSQTTAYAELWEMCNNKNAIEKIALKCDIQHILQSHPYDISGGEQQRLALAKVLLLKPDILLLDEPTKGFDSYFKKQFAQILQDLKQEGVTIIAVSHDIEFCAKYADRCAMFFDGNVTSEGNSREFFAGKSFYTTSASRMSGGILTNAVYEEDIINIIKENRHNE